MRAFIPDPLHAEGGEGFIVPRPNSSAGSLVRLRDADSALNMCFATDDRGFSTDKTSTSRIETRFTLGLSADGKGTVTPARGRTIAMQTSRVDCATGSTIEQKLGSVDRDNLGEPTVADGVVQVAGQVQGRNVLTPLGASGPAIDYSFDIQWKPATSTLTASINIGSFPAFEVYARRPGGSWVPVVRQFPAGKPWMLTGDSFGLFFGRKVETVTIPGLTGKWQSPPPESRFALEFNGDRVRWSERSAVGVVLTREVALRELPNGGFRIERPNDAEVLAFLGYQPSLRAQILARSPNPSFMDILWEGDDFRGEWNGLVVTKDAKAQLKEVVQPGGRPAKSFSFVRVKE
ncbi:hypothetical protein HMI49_03340 [Corallococcus exercitus]|uniref:Uncharacterized protein n=1 Tax=Corallococcus exercitus TaxID=2316736 RepID=A0A7Y4NP86_9BACT|nr:hypothetical protein [Corallococcus exercitus]NOK32240.1 hypothetical protein [Corallococcus exercitus]